MIAQPPLSVRYNTAVLRPESALKSTLFSYTIPPYLNISIQQFYNKGIDIKSLSPEVTGIISVACLHHCRISELLNLTIASIFDVDHVFVQGLKRSSSYTLWLPTLSKQVEDFCITDKSQKLFNVKYLRIYRECRRAGLHLTIPGRQNTVVTHAARYSVARRVHSISTITNASEVMRHKSLRSILYYTNS